MSEDWTADKRSQGQMMTYLVLNFFYNLKTEHAVCRELVLTPKEMKLLTFRNYIFEAI